MYLDDKEFCKTIERIQSEINSVGAAHIYVIEDEHGDNGYPAVIELHNGVGPYVLRIPNPTSSKIVQSAQTIWELLYEMYWDEMFFGGWQEEK